MDVREENVGWGGFDGEVGGGEVGKVPKVRERDDEDVAEVVYGGEGAECGGVGEGSAWEWRAVEEEDL